MTAIYLDNNATTALDPAVKEAMSPYLESDVGNPSSRHQLGRRARQAIDRAKLQIAEALDADPSEIIFTSGATEANNLAVLGSEHPHGRYYASPAEHPSVTEATAELSRRGRRVMEIPLTPSGSVVLPEIWKPAPLHLAAIQLANSETGVVQDVVSLKRELPDEARLHCDAVQAVGKIPVHFHALGASTMSFSGHKIHGPVGVGALLVRQGIRLRPLLFGGHQQNGLRPGTEPVASIVGLGEAVHQAVMKLDENARRLQLLRDRFEEAILREIPDAVLNVAHERRLPNTSNISFLGCDAEPMIMALDLAGVCCSAGTACASGSLEPSPVLEAMAVPDDRLNSALRFSMSRFTSEADVERAVPLVVRAAEQIRSSFRKPA